MWTAPRGCAVALELVEPYNMFPETSESSSPVAQNRVPKTSAVFQFTVLQLLLLMLVLSVAFTVLFALPDLVASGLLSIVAILMMVLLTSGIVYARGRLRAYCIGALVPLLLVAIVVACEFVVVAFEVGRNDYQEAIDSLVDLSGGLRVVSVTGWLIAIVTGMLSVGVRQCFAASRSAD
jgi:hypothetical protein